MLLSAVLLENIGGVNTFTTSKQIQFTQGDSLSVYLQLVDLAKNLRYIPDENALLEVVLQNIDSAKQTIKPAIQPFSGDRSIWQFDILSSDNVSGGTSLLFTLNEGLKTTRGSLKLALNVSPLVSAYIKC